MSVYEIRRYLTRDGKDVYLEWQRSLRDTKARIAIDRRVNRIELGNFGDHKFCRDGVWELRIDLGPGYRIYYASLERRWCYCCAVVISARRMWTLTVPVTTGRTGRGGQKNERPTA